MNHNRYLPLTETTFYILTALHTPSHGYEIMQTVERLSNGEVRIAAGTMYGALENLSKQKMIEAVPGQDARRKTYQLTPLGVEILQLDILRIRQMLTAAEQVEVKV